MRPASPQPCPGASPPPLVRLPLRRATLVSVTPPQVQEAKDRAQSSEGSRRSRQAQQRAALQQRVDEVHAEAKTLEGRFQDFRGQLEKLKTGERPPQLLHWGGCSGRAEGPGPRHFCAHSGTSILRLAVQPCGFPWVSTSGLGMGTACFVGLS